MNLAYLNTPDFSFFSDATKQIDYMIEQLQSDSFCNNEHGDIEQYIQNEGFEILRCLFQGYLDLKAANEKSLSGIYTDEGIHLTHTKVFKDYKKVEQILIGKKTPLKEECFAKKKHFIEKLRGCLSRLVDKPMLEEKQW